MRRCTVLYNNLTNCNITLTNDDKVVVSCMGDYKVDSFLKSTNIEELNLVYKPTVMDIIPENGFKIGNLVLNGMSKSCVISATDVNNLADLASTYNIESVNVYNYLDIVSDKCKKEDSVLVLCEWTTNLVAVIYMEYGEVLDFKRTSLNKLSTLLSKMRNKYRCRVIHNNNFSDYLDMRYSISNYNNITSDKLLFLLHIPYIFENAGMSVLEGKPSRISVSDDDLGLSSMESVSIDKVEITDDGVVLQDNFVDNIPKESLFQRLFKKRKSTDRTKSKSSNKISFNYDDLDDDDDDSFSNVATGDIDRILHNSFGKKLGAKREPDKFDYLFYGVSGILCTCMCLGLVFNFVYKGKLDLISGKVDTLIKVKNQRETNVALSSDPSKSPAIKMSQLNALSLPPSYSIKDVDYDGSQYIMELMIEINDKDNIDNLHSYLPDDLVISSVVDVNGGDIDTETIKNYQVILLVS